MSFPFNLYLLTFGSAFLAALVSLPAWRRWCERIGLVDDPGHRKIHEQPVPLAGGFCVMTGLVVPILSGVAAVALNGNLMGIGIGALLNQLTGPDTADLLQYGLQRRAWQLIAIFLGASGMFLLGWLDDKHELGPAAKFSGQFLIAVLVAASGIRITLFVPNALFSYAVTVLWILTVTNAFNFMDNMNGLCAGLGAIGSWQLGLSAAIHGQYLVATLAFSIAGALLGFLPHNFPRATAFLGDAGSHLVGYLLAVLAILPHFYSEEHPNVWAVLMPLLIMAIPLGDLVWVVLLRWRIGQPFYVGDTNHLSHRLARLGLSRSASVTLIWLMAAVLGSIAFL
ncbi:MAG: undecaprenyl/decaprenyl-phosphate alpha-N-acetylglucosaminyl 1-phosphate transferase [Verrucomicrobia bacterium]|nr:undecaprenyl/decaprenyl-phosphate alpha-N-acetylglucosaminyl 1-phosphate transferase [Verrucomicrobiota bacterium]